MTEIITERLSIRPTHKNYWSIYDLVDQNMIGKLFFRNSWFNIILKPQSLRLGVATEASYGLMKAINNDQYKAKTSIPHAQQFLLNLGFIDLGTNFKVTAQNLTCPDLYTFVNHQLNIDVNTLQQKKISTAVQLVDSDIDCFNRPTKLHPKAHQAWQKMKSAAQDEGIELQSVSAFRSLSYQAHLIHKKLQQGLEIADILAVNAAPGHSEHHTGCAIDITTTDFQPLAESFAQSPAFKWLSKHASEFGFVMSYPKGNNNGIIYEPWHWCYHHQTNTTFE